VILELMTQRRWGTVIEQDEHRSSAREAEPQARQDYAPQIR
jgi:hypothetical protein